MFMISRFHEETKLQDNRLGAMRKTVGKIGIVITASAFRLSSG
jgi:uncharacterized membrane protein YdfJ with MMPL/SSD domain